MIQPDQVMPETIVQKLHDKEVFNQDVIFDHILINCFKSIKEIQYFMDKENFESVAREFGFLTKDVASEKLQLLKDEISNDGSKGAEMQLLDNVRDKLRV